MSLFHLQFSRIIPMDIEFLFDSFLFFQLFKYAIYCHLAFFISDKSSAIQFVVSLCIRSCFSLTVFMVACLLIV